MSVSKIGVGVRVQSQGLRHPEGCMTYCVNFAGQQNETCFNRHSLVSSKRAYNVAWGIIINDRDCINQNTRHNLYQSLNMGVAHFKPFCISVTLRQVFQHPRKTQASVQAFDAGPWYGTRDRGL